MNTIEITIKLTPEQHEALTAVAQEAGLNDIQALIQSIATAEINGEW